MAKKPKLVAFSLRLTETEHEALLAIAAKIGHGATPTGIIRQAITEKINAMRP